MEGKRRKQSKATKGLPDRIEPGEYEAICYKVEVGWCFNRRSAYCHFRICSGAHSGVNVTMACPYPENGVSYRTKLYTQCMLALGRPPSKKERVSPKMLLNKMYRIVVRDTDRKFDGTSIRMPSYAQYSVVDTILEALTGVPRDV